MSETTLDKMTAKEVAEEIHGYLKRWEADPVINAVRSEYGNTRRFYMAGASAIAGRVSIRYVGYHGRGRTLTLAQARWYLRKLRNGLVGEHYHELDDMPKPEDEAPLMLAYGIDRFDKTGKPILVTAQVTKFTPKKGYWLKVPSMRWGAFGWRYRTVVPQIYETPKAAWDAYRKDRAEALDEAKEQVRTLQRELNDIDDAIRQLPVVDSPPPPAFEWDEDGE